MAYKVSGLRSWNLNAESFESVVRLDGPRPGVPHHTFDFEGPRDPSAMVQELEAKGIKVENVRMHGSDPCGNRIELSTDPA